MAKTVVTLPNLKKSGISGIKEMRDTVGHVIDAAVGEELKSYFYQAGLVLYNRLESDYSRHSPSKGNKAFSPGTLLRGLFITLGKAGKPNVLVGVSGKGGANYLALWLEFGTFKQQARPVFRPAMLASKPDMVPIIANGIQTVFQEATQ